ncbi:MAG: DUF5009 domain-containing protein [bacterium]|nr:DUF5009 domain-containing protein [bacterium]
MRLKSLDIMRGGVILFLTVIQPILLAWIAFCAQLGDPLPEWFCESLTHVRWEGWHLWDLVMPTFIFMCGAAVPFALPKYLTERGLPTGRFFIHLIWRVGTLWLLGMMIQGRLLTGQWDLFYFFTNTLQAIAVGYAATALVALIPWRMVRFAIPFVLMAIYGILLHDHGGYEPTNNLAYEVEQAVLPGLQDDPKYTWVLTSMMYSAMAMLGALCGEVLKGNLKWFWKALILAGLGLFLLGSGFGLSYYIPVIKAIYTVSFTCIAMGIAVLTLGGLYFIIDGLGICYGFGLVTMFGQFALVAYIAREFLFYPVLIPLGRKLGEWAKDYHYYANQTEVALQAKEGPAFAFWTQVIASLVIVWIVYLWATRKRAIKALQKKASSHEA